MAPTSAPIQPKYRTGTPCVGQQMGSINSGARLTETYRPRGPVGQHLAPGDGPARKVAHTHLQTWYLELS